MTDAELYFKCCRVADCKPHQIDTAARYLELASRSCQSTIVCAAIMGKRQILLERKE